MVKWRTIQSPHQSEEFTLEQAMEAWRKVEEKSSPAIPKTSKKPCLGSSRTGLFVIAGR